MDILQIIPIMDPDNLWTGPHSVVFDISKRLARKGHNVTVCTSDMVNIKTKIAASSENVFDDFEIVRVKNVSSHLSNAIGFLITPALNKFLSEHIQDYDLIHIHEYRTYQNIVVHKYAKKHGVPYILQAHGSIPRIGKRFRKWLYDITFGYNILQDASKVIALSRIEAEQYKRMGVPEEKIAIIPNGIDLSEYADLPPKGCFKKKFGIKEDERIVLYLARIHKIKGVDILVRAFANVIKKLNDVRLVVVGPDDGYLGELGTLIKALKMENNVLITGPLYGRDKLEAYVDADVYVLPSRYETFPMSILEALACGTPIILTENCGIAEYFRDKTGLVVKTDSPSNLQEALLEMLMNRKKQKVFRENCKTIMQKFNISKTVPKLEKIYEEL